MTKKSFCIKSPAGRVVKMFTTFAVANRYLNSIGGRKRGFFIHKADRHSMYKPTPLPNDRGMPLYHMCSYAGQIIKTYRVLVEARETLKLAHCENYLHYSKAARVAAYS